MIPTSLHLRQPPAWQRELQRAVTDPAELLAILGLGSLLRQILPLGSELDDARVLAELSETSFAAGVLPYYLHLLDHVAGAAHFEVPEHEARGLWSGISARLPGYLVPRLVREIPGAPAKTMLPPASR
jgi:L-lysine 2,3-aminomutase